ncbi:TPA: ead/Ea22-like family protein [Escherichia coli]|nr:ead/Ea22-like family protein [Escherichia coli]HBK2733183.1 ead/Ea22-like family protein [Escherichia coli]HBK2742545.1 ead/Ea22-like family protein [Escherichia coli]HBK2838804.1 ead/Ea22-like family protein [Escherichia coli]HBK2843999.1 ead/Ea22-like family protein [Escherichia coli]
MSKIDYQALREKAEKATCGVWSLEYGEGRFDGDDALIHREVAGYIPICRIEGAYPESGFDEDFQMEQQANAEFIAAASPATVLALLDERERNQQYIKSRDQENEDIALTVGRLRVELEAEEKTSAARLEALDRTHKMFQREQCRAEAAEKRIAELEAREVQLPTRYDLRYGHPINADERHVMIPKENGSWLYLIDLEHALRVADIRIKGE